MASYQVFNKFSDLHGESVMIHGGDASKRRSLIKDILSRINFDGLEIIKVYSPNELSEYNQRPLGAFEPSVLEPLWQCEQPCIVFDDFAFFSDPGRPNLEALQTLINGEHNVVTRIAASEQPALSYYKFKYLFILRETRERIIRMIYNRYILRQRINRTTFNTLLSQNIEDNQALVIDLKNWDIYMYTWD